MDLLSVVLGFGVLLISLTIHEAAHALTADRLGDPTARSLGRVSLNPLVHIDLIGTVVLPLLAAVSHLPLIGWAKPVPVNIRNLRHPQRDFCHHRGRRSGQQSAPGDRRGDPLRVVSTSAAGGAGSALRDVPASSRVQVNLLLAFFNLIPVPPLDGGNVLLGLLPPRLAVQYSQMRQFGFLILYALLLTGMASAIIRRRPTPC